MPEPISAALIAWITKQLAETTRAAVRRRQLRDSDAPEVRGALVAVMRSAVKRALLAVFPDDCGRRKWVLDLLLERPSSEWPLVDGTHLCDLPGAIREWVSSIESPPDETGEVAQVSADHPFLSVLCTSVFECLRHEATRGAKVLTEVWMDFKIETGISTGRLKPVMQSTAPPVELCFEPRYWTDRTEIIESLIRHFQQPSPCPVILTGPSGSGKTALAGVLASRLSEYFQDGVLHLEPNARRPEDELYSALERIGGINLPSTATEIERLYRSVLGSRSMIVILDEPEGRINVERFWPRSSSTAYLVLTSKEIRWREAVTMELPPLEPEDSTALLQAAEALPIEDVEKLVAQYGCVPGRLLDAAGIVAAGAMGADQLAPLAGNQDDTELFLRRLNSVSVPAQRMYQVLAKLPDPILEPSLLDLLAERSGAKSSSKELMRAQLLVEVAPALWSLRSEPGRPENGDAHD